MTLAQATQLGYARLIEIITERDERISRLFKENNETEQKRRLLAAELKGTQVSLRAFMKLAAKRDERIAELGGR
jgi:hypothetical protein